MQSAVDVRVLGVVVRILVPGDDVRSAVRQAWRECLTDTAEGVADSVRVPATRSRSPEEVGRLLQGLTQQVTGAAIRARAGSLMMFHAAALCDQSTGATLAVVAPGGTGKTTVVRTLGRGRGYVTDETVGVEHDGSVVPYLKPLSVRR
jgi:hypothetical protein